MLLCVATLVTVYVLCADSTQIPGSKLPKWITACYRDDPNFDECAVKSGQDIMHRLVKGERKLRLPVLDPFHIVEIKLDREATNLGMDLALRNVDIYGARDTIVKAVHGDFKNQKILLKALIPSMELISAYTIAGKILVLPITGTGPGNITLKNVLVDFDIDYKLVKNPKDGLDYPLVVDHKVRFETTRLHVKLDNLFNGNKLIGDSTNQFLNDNWKEMVSSIGPIISDTIGHVMIQIFGVIAEQIPFDDFVPPLSKKPQAVPHKELIVDHIL